MTEFREVATGLRFPEGPVAMADGSVLVVEIARGTLSRVDVETGAIDVVAEPGGGPNGAAMGPDGKVYLCNNGGCLTWHERDALIMAGFFPDDGSYSGGRIERVDITTGDVEVLYAECDGRPLLAPNDLVFDEHGGFWFTDHGLARPRATDRTGVFYAKADGSFITEASFPLEGPNGVGLSPAGDRLYVAETPTARVWTWPITSPGELGRDDNHKGPFGPRRGGLLAGVGGLNYFDSLAVDSAGNVCVGTLVNGGITVISPDGAHVDHVALPDVFVTNICFGGPDLRTAYVTMSTTGRLVALDWPRPGLRLAY